MKLKSICRKGSTLAELLVGCFGLFLILPVLVFLLAVFNAWVVHMLWGYYIAPTFNLTELTMVQAYGLSVFITYLTYHHGPDLDKVEDDRKPSGKVILTRAVSWLLARIFGYLLVIGIAALVTFQWPITKPVTFKQPPVKESAVKNPETDGFPK